MASRSLCRAQAPRSLAGRLCAESARGCGVRDAQARDAGSALTQGEWGVMLRGCCARGGSRAANKATEEPVTHTGIAAWRRCPPAPPPLLPCQPLPLLAPSQHRALYIPAARPAPPRACTAQAGAAGGGGRGGWRAGRPAQARASMRGSGRRHYSPPHTCVCIHTHRVPCKPKLCTRAPRAAQGWAVQVTSGEQGRRGGGGRWARH